MVTFQRLYYDLELEEQEIRKVKKENALEKEKYFERVSLYIFAY